MNLYSVEKINEFLIKNAPPHFNYNEFSYSEAEKEIIKCSNVENGLGFLYFYYYYCFFPHPTKNKVWMKESAYEWQKLACVELLQRKRVISKKNRQVGFSTITQGFALWRATFLSNQKIVVISLGQRESQEFLEKLEFCHMNLPSWLKQPKIVDMATKIRFKNKSEIRSLPNSPNAGRSASISLLILDEFAEYGKNQKKIMSAAGPALGPGFKGNFTNENLPSQLFIVSTWPEVAENNEYVRILKEARDNPESIYKIINPTTHDNEFYNDNEWHEQMKVELGPHGYNREVLGIEDSHLEEPFIPHTVLNLLIPKQTLRAHFLYPDDVDESGYYVDFKNFHLLREPYDARANYIHGLWIFKDPFPNKEYGIATDVSTGRANDFSAFHVFDLETLEQVAEYKGKAGTEDLKKIIRKVAEYYNKAKLSVERNSMGEGVCQWLGKGEIDEVGNYITQPYENMYFHRESKTKFVPGFPVNPGTRPLILASLQNAFLKEPPMLIINSERTISELKTLGFNKFGKVEGISNTDDLVMSLAQFVFLREKFFLSERVIMNDQLVEQEEKENVKRKNHYLSQYEITPESQEFLDYASVLGASLSMDDLNSMLN